MYYVDKRIRWIKNDYKNKHETWHVAIRLLEKHLTRRNVHKKSYEIKIGEQKNGSYMRGASGRARKATKIQNNREVQREKRRLNPSRRRSNKNMACKRRVSPRPRYLQITPF